MKKIFGALLVALVLLTANITHAAKIKPLAEIDVYNFFLNMGYEVDCSHWERYEGKNLFAAMIPEDPLIISKEFANIEVCSEVRKGYIVDITLFFRAGSDGDEMTFIAAKVFNALNPDAFQTSQAAIEKSLTEFLSAPQVTETVLNFDKTRCALAKEIQRDKVIISIKVAAE